MDAPRLLEPRPAELARTTFARARAARIDCSCAGRPGGDPVTASMRADQAGQPVLLFASVSVVEKTSLGLPFMREVIAGSLAMACSVGQ